MFVGSIFTEPIIFVLLLYAEACLCGNVEETLVNCCNTFYSLYILTHIMLVETQAIADAAIWNINRFAGGILVLYIYF